MVHNLYDAAGRRILSYLTINGTFDAFTHYSYDAQDRVTNIQRGSLDVANANDWMGPTDFSGNSNPVTFLAVNYSYDVFGNVTNLSRYNDSSWVGTSLYTYDTLGRMTAIDSYFDSTAHPELHEQYVYDALSRVVWQSGNTGTGYNTYNAANELVASEIASGGNDQWTYDTNGNRVQHSVFGNYTPGPDNQISYSPGNSATPGGHYTYDKAGNLSAISFDDGASATLTWDARNYLTSYSYTHGSSSSIDFTITFTYDGTGRRTSKHYTGTDYSNYQQTDYTETYIWDGDDLLAVFNTNGPFQRYLMAPGQNMVLAQDTLSSTWVPDTENGGGPDNGYYDPGDGPGNWVPTLAVLWAITDHLGSVQALLHNEITDDRHLDWVQYTDTYGTRYDGGSENHAFRFGFTGYQYDQEIHLYYANARYYTPIDGRFISKDPMGFDAGDTNLYRYVGNHPANGRDPTGLRSVVETTLTVGISEAMDALIFLSTPTLETTAPLWVRCASIAMIAFIATCGITITASEDSPLRQLLEEMVVKKKPGIVPEAEADPDTLVKLKVVTAAEARRLHGSVPIYFEPADIFPHEAANAEYVIDHDVRRALLTYAGDGVSGADERRQEAISWAKSYQADLKPKTDYLNSWDEYPFASTQEGGGGAHVVPAPLEENRDQGIDLKAFYDHEHFSKRGEPFLVIPVAKRPFAY